MRYVKVTKDQFDDLLYPAFATGSAENEEELETATRLRFKFRKMAKAEVISDEEMENARKRRMKLVPYLKMESNEDELFVEEDEYKLLLKRLRAYIPQVSMGIAENLSELLTVFKNAEARDVKPAEASDKPAEPGPRAVV